MTPPKNLLERFKEAREKATQGEMIFLKSLKVIQSEQDDLRNLRPYLMVQDKNIRPEDAEFICLAANDGPKLIQAVEMLLEGYANYGDTRAKVMELLK